MRSLVRWAVDNTPAVNVIVVCTLITGLVSFFWLRREVFPEFELEIVFHSSPLPRARRQPMRRRGFPTGRRGGAHPGQHQTPDRALRPKGGVSSWSSSIPTSAMCKKW